MENEEELPKGKGSQNTQIAKSDKEKVVGEILFGVEARIPDPGSNEELDKHLDRSKALGYRVANPTWERVVETAQLNGPRYPEQFYNELYRLTGIKKPKGRGRPWIFARITDHIVYLRWKPEILAELRRKNPSDSQGKRKYKHYNFLSKLGEVELDEYIKDAIDMMVASDTWPQFSFKMARKYGTSCQLSLFENYEI